MPAETQAVAGTEGRRVIPDGRIQPGALLALAVLAVVWSWWAVKAGAFFGTVLLPGAVALCAAAILLAATAPWRARLRLLRAAPIALASLIGLGIWSGLSALWSPTPDVAITDGQRILVYALAFGLGIWLCNLLGSHMHLALLPLALAGAFAGALTVVTLLSGDDVRRYVEIDGTLRFPLGYRNANAAFFLIAFWPALGLASRRDGDWRLRAPALATATLCLSLGMLCQSRASLLAGAAAACAYLVLSRDLSRGLVWLALAALPALVVIPALTDLYQAANGSAPLSSLLDELRGAGRALALASAVGLVVGAAAALLERRLPTSPRRAVIANRVVAAGLVTAVLGGSIAFVAVVGNPIDWIGQRVSQFRSGQEPSATGKTRFSFNAGTGRGDLWRVALLDARRHPLLGVGGGGYHYSYLRERRAESPVTVLDAHSVELETLSELGVPGLLLFTCAITGAGAGALRSRRLGPAAASVSAVALAAGTYWLVHSSLDWLWPYPALTASVLALLGSACAPALRVADRAPPGWGRRALAIAAAALAVSAIPPFLSDRYVDAAYADWREDLKGAYTDLDHARSWNPLSVDPLLAEGAIARAAGDRRRAIDSFRRAAEKRPEEWVTHYFLALLYRRDAPRLARRQAALATARDPHNPQVASLRRKLEHSSSLGRPSRQLNPG